MSDHKESKKERTTLNKYERIYQMACERNTTVSWVDTAIMSLAADLAEYTGEEVRVSGPYGMRSEVIISCGTHRSVVTPEISEGKKFLRYDTGEKEQRYAPGTYGEINGFNNLTERLPETLDEIAAIFAPGNSATGKYPYSRADLEALISGVVDYEAEEPDGLGWQNLQAMGFNDEDMLFFGMPPYLEEEEED